MSMQLQFCKYQGTGNDFVMVDNRLQHFPKNDTKRIHKICDRRFGIGADGLILLEEDPNYDFRMVYYNSDGNESSMCGNGGRCLVAFAKSLGIIENEAYFAATDGPHFATINDENIVSLQMKDVEEVKIFPDYTFLDTGSPHHVEMVESLSQFDVRLNGAAIRYSDRYIDRGTNVNFVTQRSPDEFIVRTYERGVEDETLSCGTGVTAVAIAMNATGKTTANHIKLAVEGGSLEVSFKVDNGHYSEVFLTGPATFVFAGKLDF